VGNGNGVSRGDRNRNARLARLRMLVPVSNAFVGIDLADAKQMVVVTDHDSKVLAGRRSGAGLGSWAPRWTGPPRGAQVFGEVGDAAALDDVGDLVVPVGRVGFQPLQHAVLAGARLLPGGDSPMVAVTVTNTDTRDSREVVQAYFQPAEADQPVRLVGLAGGARGARTSVPVAAHTDARLWRQWDTAEGGWTELRGAGQLLVARGSATSAPLSTWRPHGHSVGLTAHPARRPTCSFR
jgi:hypothetical protein